MAFGPLLAYLHNKGIPRSQYANRLGVPVSAFDDETARVPVYRLLLMWQHAIDLSGDGDLGLHFAEFADFNSFGGLSALAVSSPTIGDGLSALTRTIRYLLGTDAYRLIVEGEVAVFRRVRAIYEPVERHSSECLLGVPHLHATKVSQEPWQLLEVTFSHARPLSTALHARLFGCPVRFGAKHDELRFPVRLLSSRSSHRDDALAERLRVTTERLTAEVAEEDDVVGAARVAAWQRLREAGDTSLEGVAAHMGLSTRTLQRRLAALGTSHRQVLDEVRSTVSQQLFADGSGLADVAVLLGFSEQTAFQRAFRRWTGQSPARFREQWARSRRAP